MTPGQHVERVLGPMEAVSAHHFSQKFDLVCGVIALPASWRGDLRCGRTPSYSDYPYYPY